MAQWKETLEPYVKVIERIKTAAVNPVAGQDLVIGAVIISDAGPSIPTLITSQTEFLNTYASQDLTQEYVNSINNLYKGDDSSLAATMWLNAYRLAGSANLLVVRASKASNINFAMGLDKDDNNVYILRDGQLLKKVQEFKIVVDVEKDNATHTNDGWALAISDSGVVGNRNTDEGAQYDYFVQNLEELVDYLNETPKFFSPSYTFYSDEKGETPATTADEALSVVFHEVYLGANILDVEETRCTNGLNYVVTCEPDWTSENPKQGTIDLNASNMSGFTAPSYYVTNEYNSSTSLKVRIRRFNHDAVVTKELSENDCNAGGASPYTVLTSVLDTFTRNGGPSDEIKERDFYEIAVLDPSIDSEPLYFNIGNISGRGDMSVSDFNDNVNMIGVTLPDDMSSLGLGYYGYLPADQTSGWSKILNPTADQTSSVTNDYTFDTKAEMEAATSVNVGTIAVVGKSDPVYYAYTTDGGWAVSPDTTSGEKYIEETLESLNAHIVAPQDGDIALVGTSVAGVYYIYKDGITLEDVDDEELYVDVSIDPEKYDILDVSDTDLVKALDLILQDEVYTTEGLTDLGCTSSMFQTAMANMAISDNYFYPFSTINSTNYIAIANAVNRMSQDSCKLYTLAPWDVDTGTVGFKYYAAPSTLFWEAVCRNRSLDREFASVFGFGATGVVSYQDPVVEFNKKQRQLLLSKKINTVLWNTSGQTWQMNDSVTKQTEDNILGEDGNSRLFIRINKAMPTLLKQFIGRKINDVLYYDAQTVIDYWFRSTIMPMQYTIDDYRITIADINTEEDQRANRMKVLVEVRFARSLKYIIVYSDAYDMGMEFTGTV